jgi:hypothetical protein
MRLKLQRLNVVELNEFEHLILPESAQPTMEMSDFDSGDKGCAGEDRAALYLRQLFFEIQGRPSPDRGTDLLCKSFRSGPSAPAPPAPWFRFQVKSGPSYLSHIDIPVTTFDYYLRHLETEPVVFLHYEDGAATEATPDWFLILDSWVRRNLHTVGERFKSGTEVRIPHSDFERVEKKGAANLIASLRSEATRAGALGTAALSTRRAANSPNTFSSVAFQL